MQRRWKSTTPSITKLEPIDRPVKVQHRNPLAFLAAGIGLAAAIAGLLVTRAFGCFRGPTPARTNEIYQRLSQENVVVSLREGNIRVAPYLFNTEHDIDRLLDVVSSMSAVGARARDGDS